MPNIKKISALRNYSQVLSEVEMGSPVYLTKDGDGAFAIVDIKEYDRLKKSAWQRLIDEASVGDSAGHEQGWLSADEVEQNLRQLGRSDG